MRQRTQPTESAHREYSVNEAAQLLGLSRWTVTRMFEHEPGARIYGNEKSTRNRRRQRTLRIPEYVLRRVQERHTISKRSAAPSQTRSSCPAKERDCPQLNPACQPDLNAMYPPKHAMGEPRPEHRDKSEHERHSQLTNREREVYLLFGKSYKEIASELNITESTVKFHMGNITQKLGRSRKEILAKNWLERQ